MTTSTIFNLFHVTFLKHLDWQPVNLLPGTTITHPFLTSYHHHPLQTVVLSCFRPHHTLAMASALPNPFAPMLGTIRDLPAHPASVEKILNIILLQLQLLMSTTLALTRTVYNPIVTNPTTLVPQPDLV